MKKPHKRHLAKEIIIFFCFFLLFAAVYSSCLLYIKIQQSRIETRSVFRNSSVMLDEDPKNTYGIVLKKKMYVTFDCPGDSTRDVPFTDITEYEELSADSCCIRRPQTEKGYEIDFDSTGQKLYILEHRSWQDFSQLLKRRAYKNFLKRHVLDDQDLETYKWSSTGRALSLGLKSSLEKFEAQYQGVLHKVFLILLIIVYPLRFLLLILRWAVLTLRS